MFGSSVSPFYKGTVSLAKLDPSVSVSTMALMLLQRSTAGGQEQEVFRPCA